ncbi:MAG TPA: hypothetical protein VGR21_06545 [Cryptosporangiaceae bacterium]|nr:hypothetical protein [Cryptosporangiaceae bacterium]
MATHDDTTLLFPIGHCVGSYYGLSGPTDHFHQVRVGPDVVRLSDEQFAMWGLAHGAPDRPAGQPWNRQRLLETARKLGVSTAEEVLDGLVADHLVVETTPGTDDAVDFARRHRMVPLMLGLGNSAEEPRLYGVGLAGQPILQMTSAVYDLYEWAHMDPDLWTACHGAADTARQVEIDDPTSTDPLRLLDALLATLHTLLGPNAVYLDTRLAS